ncbi:MAG: glucose-6-phosphate isomerase [Tissierellia bacterium]|nr:glucose-6-phosphate isomerase [Tissierellia bacterium]
MIRLNLDHAFLQGQLSEIKDQVLQAKDLLLSGKGQGNDYLGWIKHPVAYDVKEYKRIKEAAEKIRRQSKVLVAIGIGGSYLGAQAVIDALNKSYEKPDLEVIFVGNHLSSTQTKELIDYIYDKDFSINVISKSGTTTEPAVAFRIFKEILEERYGLEEARERIYATTDSQKGALKTLASKMGYETFVVPDDIGGRFSVLSAVGLLPIAAAGFDIDQLMKGAKDQMDEAIEKDFEENSALQYAAMRNLLYRDGKKIEILASYEPKLRNIMEWWKQLYGESEGKDHKALFPVSVSFTTDLHSLGQIIQDGERIIFETVIRVEKPLYDLEIKEDAEDLDGLNYLAGKTMDYVNKAALMATVQAHVSGQVPNMILEMEKIDEYNLGSLFYFFEFAAGVSGYILGVNPFNQPGVEEYKKNMFKILEKPGY